MSAPGWIVAVVKRALPAADRETLIADLLEFHARRRGRDGGFRADVWLASQAVVFPVHGMIAGARDALVIGVPGSLVPAVRSWVRDPRTALPVMLTLAISLGLGSAVFAVVRATVLRPAPFPASEQLVRVWPTVALTHEQFDRLADGLSGSEVSAVAGRLYTVVEAGAASELDGMAATPGLLGMLGVRPLLGRDLASTDAVPGAVPVVLLGHHVWRSRFGGAPDVIGRSVELARTTLLPMATGAFTDGRVRVIGVLPPEFAPFGGTVDVVVPLARDRGASSYGDLGELEMFARIAPGESIASFAARARAAASADVFGPDYLEAIALDGVVPLERFVAGDAAPVMFAILGGVVLFLLLACANVANLLLVHGHARAGDHAIRRALGASRPVLATQRIVETLVISLAAGALGLLTARLALPGLVALLPPGLTNRGTVRLDGLTLAVGFAATTAVALLAGGLPAWSAARFADRRSTDTRATRRAAGALITVQVALAFSLALGAGLLGRSLIRVANQDSGFEPAGAWTLRLAPSTAGYAEIARRRAFYDEVLTGIRSLPGIEAAGAIHRLPLADDGVSVYYRPATPGVADGEDRRAAAYRVITPGYLDAVGMRLVAGRDLSSSDGTGGAPVGLINRAMAARHWPDGDALGQTLLRFNGRVWFRVVGIVDDVRQHHLDSPSEPEAYLPLAQSEWASAMSVVVRAADPDLPGIRAVVARADAGVPVTRILRLGDVVRNSVSERRFHATLFAVFSVLAILLAAVGVFGVVSRAVATRAREFGVRLAIGASPGAVMRAALRGVLPPVAAGTALGVLLAAWLSRAIAGMLFETGRHDPATYAVVGLILVAASLLAAWVPARRAGRVDVIASLAGD